MSPKLTIIWDEYGRVVEEDTWRKSVLVPPAVLLLPGHPGHIPSHQINCQIKNLEAQGRSTVRSTSEPAPSHATAQLPSQITA